MTLLQKSSKLVLNPIVVVVATLLCTAFLYLLEQQAGHMPFVMLCVTGIAAVVFLG
ncbi:MAG: hypothetical protein H5U12_08990, partial [Hoeflea sp.]|nr:hypothetical protein [Hoeflea sp.]